MSDTVKGMLLSKTVWLNVLMAFAVIVDGDDIKQFISLETLVKIQAGLNIVMRFYTRVALADKLS